jgi:hypothetical protein
MTWLRRPIPSSYDPMKMDTKVVEKPFIKGTHVWLKDRDTTVLSPSMKMFSNAKEHSDCVITHSAILRDAFPSLPTAR